MDSKLQAISLGLRAMESDQAASWLIATYPLSNPEYGDVFQLLRVRSWKRVDQIRLARYYLQKIPFASEKPYEVFASFMSIKLFISVLKELLPKRRADVDLLVYHLQAVLEKAAQTSDDRDAVNAFLNELFSMSKS
ncbi:hypothetical protein E6C76_06950 [Pseudothauera nasutitermitis]|uniref:Uncharacterized protein n=1 Tax=Pseudothauera nasutitermitis TaxID=2565930 RepID=A0A4S4B250_9RHOO|nr:hypothetical protein [Pseudothauera nasutitermitis]THF66563.1 hypothetical protein E6C76_06950 [Pseudothauera nasutitermitis]